MLSRELIKFRYHSARLDHCLVTYGQINQHYSNDNFASPSWNRSGSMVTINSTFGWRSVTTPSRLVAWHVVAVGYAVGVCADCGPCRWFNRCYLKQNVQCCRTEAVQGRALAVTAFTTLSSWPSFSYHIIFKSYKFSNLEIYSTYITVEFSDIIVYRSVLMTLIKCTREVPKEGFPKSQNYVRRPYKVKCSWSVAADCGHISAQSHHTVTHLVQAWLQIKSDIVVEFGLLHSQPPQPITNNHFYFLITVESCLKQHLGVRRLQSNEEVETDVRGWSQMQERRHF